MSEPIIDILGEKELKTLFTLAPRRFTATVGAFFNAEKNKFIGKNGTFAKELRSKKRKYRSGNWSPFIARSFTGKLQSSDTPDKMYMKMGLREDREKKVPWLMALAKGATIKPTGGRRFLMIPYYKNLLSVGLFGRVGNSGKNSFAKLLKNNQDKVQFLVHHNKFLVFGDFPEAEAHNDHFNRHFGRLDRKLLWVGVPRARVKQQFDFHAAWNKRLAGLTQRGERYIQRTIRGMERGYVKVE